MMNIGEAARTAGVTAKMIRYYEDIGLIDAANRSDAGYRQYTQADVHTLRFIKRSRDLGFSIERIRTLLALWQDRTRRSGDVKKLARQYIAELDKDIEKLQSIRTQLQHMAEHCNGDQRPDCPIIDNLAATGMPGTPYQE
jgi:MerR family transcriptional regulator, copper efflux regulator